MFFGADETDSASARYEQLLGMARRADDLGMCAVWTPERHYHRFGGLFPNPAVLGAAIAASTRDIGIRAGSVVSPLHEVIEIVEDWSVVDNLSHGRVQISLASGWNSIDFWHCPDRYADRKQLVEQAVAEIRRRWAGEPLAVDGPSGVRREIVAHPRPFQAEVPVWMTISGNPDSYVTAGRAGANVLTHLLGQSVDELEERIGRYREAWTANGHEGDGGEVCVMVHTLLGADHDEMVTISRPPLEDYFLAALDLDLTATTQELDAATRKELVDVRVTHHLEHSTLIGSPARCHDLLGRLAAAGVSEIACLVDFGVPYGDVAIGLDHIAELMNTEVPLAGATSPDR
jgi:natural product biosynthesis luciferase-like monooxygenase protein